MQAENVGRKLRNSARLKRRKIGMKDRFKKDRDVEKTRNYTVKKM
jgi:hypothetical protein